MELISWGLIERIFWLFGKEFLNKKKTIYRPSCSLAYASLIKYNKDDLMS